jgi:hypothetical protein
VWRDRAKWWFALGQILGGLTTAALALLLGAVALRPLLPVPIAAAAVVAVGFFVVTETLGLHRGRLPQARRQVPTSIIARGADVGALQFGFEMGTGARTFMPNGLPHLALAYCLLLADPVSSLVVGAAFGAARALMALSRTRSPDAWDDEWAIHAAKLTRLLAVIMALATILLIRSAI